MIIDEDSRSLERVAVLGSGSWGTALAMHCASLGHQVKLWDIDSSLIEHSVTDHENSRYLPGCAYPETLQPESNLTSALDGVRFVILAIPSHALSALLETIQPLVDEDVLLILASKGLAYNERQQVTTLYSLVEDHIGCGRTVVLSGPSFAKEVAEGQPTGLVAASIDIRRAQAVQKLMATSIFRVYTSEDPIGVQLCAALKNVLAIAVGIAEGLGYGANAQAVLLSRGYHEVCVLGKAMGGRTSTFLGLAGLGDLVLTCGHNLSRNRRFGLALGAGQTADQALKEIGQVVEGLKNVEEAVALGQQYQVELPIMEQVRRVIIDGVPAAEAVVTLLARTSA